MMFGETYALTLWCSSSEPLTEATLYDTQAKFQARFAKSPDTVRMNPEGRQDLFNDVRTGMSMTRLMFDGETIFGMRIEMDRDIRGWRVELAGVCEEVLPDSGGARQSVRQVLEGVDATASGTVEVRNLELVTGARREPMSAQRRADASPIDRERFRLLVLGDKT